MKQYTQKIANYIYNDMDESERDQFEAELERDEELAKEYASQLKVIDYLKSKAHVEKVLADPGFKEAERLVETHFSGGEQIRNDEPESKSTSKARSLKRIIYPILAASAVFTGIILVRYIATGNTNEIMYQKHYQPFDDGNLISRGQVGPASANYSEAIVLYYGKDYAKSVVLFSELSKEDPLNAKYALFESLATMGKGDYQNAAGLFESYLDNFEVFIPEAKWYLALCYLKMDHRENAIKYLLELSSSTDAYGEQAKRILRRIQ